MTFYCRYAALQNAFPLADLRGVLPQHIARQPSLLYALEHMLQHNPIGAFRTANFTANIIAIFAQ